MGVVEDLTAFASGLAETNPLLWVFVASLFGNLIPFIPYFLVVVTVVTAFEGLTLVQVATLSALGATIGKFTIYSVGYGAGRILSEKRKAGFNSLRKLLGGSAFLAAFIFAASPFPDDIVFIPLGIMRYSPTKTLIALFSGKFALTLLVAYLARSSSHLVNIFLGGSTIATIASIVVVVLTAVLMMRVDWEEALERRQNGFIRRALRRVRRVFRRPRTSSGPAASKEMDAPSAPT